MTTQIDIIKNYLESKFENAMVEEGPFDRNDNRFFVVLTKEKKFALYFGDKIIDCENIIEIFKEYEVVKKMEDNPSPKKVWLRENCSPGKKYIVDAE